MSARASARPVWSGSITFGLVTIPVALYTAVREKRIAFRSLHDQDKVPLKQKMVCPADGKEVHREHIVKGYEIDKDRYVVINQDEIDAAAPKATRAIEIEDFVDLDEIDPLFFDKPYHVAPEPEGAKPYRLLLDALASSKKVGIARVVMHGREYLAALRPLGDALCLETMHFNDEVVKGDSIAALHPVKAKPSDRELKMAEQLIESLTSDFEPEKYHDEYREKLMEVIEKKARGEKIVNRPPTEAAGRTSGHDLMAALEASLVKAGAGKSTSARGRTRRNATHPGHETRRRKSA